MAVAPRFDTSTLDASWDDLSPASLFTGWDHIELWVGNARQAAGIAQVHP